MKKSFLAVCLALSGCVAQQPDPDTHRDRPNACPLEDCPQPDGSVQQREVPANQYAFRR